MNKKNWEIEFDKNFIHGRGILGQGEVHATEKTVKDFIKTLLRSQQIELLEGLKKQLEMTILFSKEVEKEEKIVDWPYTISSFIEYEINTKLSKLSEELKKQF